MKTVFIRIFYKNIWIPLVLLILFAGIKSFSVLQVDASYKDIPLLDVMIAECADKSKDEIDAYLKNLAAHPDGSAGNELQQAKSAFLNSINNCDEINQMISFAKFGEGELPSRSLPPNYIRLLSFYAELKVPQIINQRPLERYFALQENNIVPILALCLAVIYWSIHYESEMYKYTRTVKRGAAYTKVYRNMLLGISILLLVSNELFDLWWSGMFSHSSLWKVSLQSYRVFRHSQMNCTIFDAFAWMWFSKFFGIWTMAIIGEWLAAAKKNLKDAAVPAFFFILALVFVGKGLASTPFTSVIQLGYVDWGNIFREAEILLPLSMSSFGLGVVLTILVPAICVESVGKATPLGRQNDAGRTVV